MALRCKCGKPATHFCVVESGIYAGQGIKSFQIGNKRYPICKTHVGPAEAAGFKTEPISRKKI